MSDNEIAFIGFNSPIRFRFPLDRILEHHAAIRDAIAATECIVSDDPAWIVTNALFIYAFNTYKAISLLLPHFYHESAAVVLRQLWEVSLNLHWIAVDPPTRARDFSNFTVMEFRKSIQKSHKSDDVAALDEVTERFQSRFRFKDARGRDRVHSCFATITVHDRAAELKDPWATEYELFYSLTSMHAHGTPGAIMHGMFKQHYGDVEVREQQSAALIGMQAIRVIVRDVQLLTQMEVIPDCARVNELYDSFQDMIAKVIQDADAGNSNGKRTP